MIKEFKEDLDILFKQPIRERIYPSLKVFNKNVFMKLMFYICHIVNIINQNITKRNFIDVHNGLCDARPLKTNSMDEVIKNLNDIYKKSKYLERPKTIQGDNQFDNKKFRDFCNGYVDG